MKKCFYSLVFLLMLSAFNVSKVDAISCIYESKGKDENGKKVQMVLYSQFTGSSTFARASPLNEFYINGERQDQNSQWSDESAWVGGFKNYSTGQKITGTSECPRYMYYDQVKDGFLTGQNKIYFSDSYPFSDQSYDMAFDLMTPYQESAENALLESMICTYQNTSSTAGDITFKISHNGTSGTYQIWLDYDKISSGKFTNDFVNTEVKKYSASENYWWAGIYNSVTISDHFSVRKFWDSETGKYACPKNILVGAEKTYIPDGVGGSTTDVSIELGYDENLMKEYKDEDTLLEHFSMVIDSADLYLYEREEHSSQIEYEYGTTNQGQTCEYGRNGQSRVWDLALKEYKYSNKNNYYVAYFNSVADKKIDTSSIESGLIDTSCDALPVVYTDCLNTTSNNCTVKAENFSNKDSSGKELVEPLYTLTELNEEDIDTVVEGMANYSGFRYKRLICELSDRMDYLDYNKSLIKRKLTVYDNMMENKSQYYIYNLPCDEWKLTAPFECDESCKSKIDYIIQSKIEDVVVYCQNIYASYSGSKNDSSHYARMEECNSFYAFYNQMIEAGIVEDYSVGCELVSNELHELLQWVLDLIKIAGPILAIVFGSLDFIKVIFSGDSDKESKEAFKRFKNRIIAAVLLFLIPVILSFCMNIILQGQEGYDPDNPFCDLE